jgi:hypothetical protein
MKEGLTSTRPSQEISTEGPQWTQTSLCLEIILVLISQKTYRALNRKALFTWPPPPWKRGLYCWVGRRKDWKKPLAISQGQFSGEKVILCSPSSLFCLGISATHSEIFIGHLLYINTILGSGVKTDGGGVQIINK